MSIWDRYAAFIYRVATGNKRLRILATPLGALFFFGLTVLFVFASLWVDDRLSFSRLGFSWWSLGLSISLLVLGWLISAWTVIAFFRARGTPVPFNPRPRLISNGFYAYVRNPMLLGLFLLLLGLGILFGSLSLIFIFTPLSILINVLYVKIIEEREMEKKFGAKYLEYRKKVPMFIPRVGAIQNIAGRQRSADPSR